ncbi:MAG: helix-turn-helix domain-containing protein [Eubacterium sp.]|nr:helix-turn-helix domain-containing protein [Eubacterium sp.]
MKKKIQVRVADKPKKKLTQNDRVIQYMRDFGSITTREAMLDLGCMRLASRIHELRRDGFPIGDKLESAKNRYGETVSYKRYFLKEEQSGSTV